jgi:hypothetical protein
MMRIPHTIIAASAILLIYSGSATSIDQSPTATESVKEESPATVDALTARLSDGTQLEITSFKIKGTKVYLWLSKGGIVAYDRENVTIANPSQPTPIPDANTATDAIALKKNSQHLRRSSTGTELSSYASNIKLPESAKDGVELTGEGRLVQPTASGQRVTAGEDDDYVADLIATREAEHLQALEEYDRRLQEMVDIRDELVTKDRRATRVCSGFTPILGFGVANIDGPYGGFWQADFRWAAFIDNSSSPACQSLLADCDVLAIKLLRGLDNLGVFARQAGILPGEARTRLNRYALR